MFTHDRVRFFDEKGGGVGGGGVALLLGALPYVADSERGDAADQDERKADTDSDTGLGAIGPKVRAGGAKRDHRRIRLHDGCREAAIAQGGGRGRGVAEARFEKGLDGLRGRRGGY